MLYEMLNKLGLKSFGVQGIIRDGELFPIEINRRRRFSVIEYGEKEKQEDKQWRSI